MTVFPYSFGFAFNSLILHHLNNVWQALCFDWMKQAAVFFRMKQALCFDWMKQALCFDWMKQAAVFIG